MIKNKRLFILDKEVEKHLQMVEQNKESVCVNRGVFFVVGFVIVQRSIRSRQHAVCCISRLDTQYRLLLITVTSLILLGRIFCYRYLTNILSHPPTLHAGDFVFVCFALYREFFLWWQSIGDQRLFLGIYGIVCVLVMITD